MQLEPWHARWYMPSMRMLRGRATMNPRMLVIAMIAAGCSNGDGLKSADEPAAQVAPAVAPPITPEPEATPAEPEQVALAGDPCDGGEAGGNPCDGGEAHELATRPAAKPRAPVATGSSPGSIGTGSAGTLGSGTVYTGRLPPRKPPRLTFGSAAVAGSIDGPVIRRVVKMHVGRFKSCYQQDRAIDPKARYRVAIKFTIGSDGKVSAASAAGGSKLLEACLVAAMKRLVFPAPKGGGSVEVSYPFMFEPLAD